MRTLRNPGSREVPDANVSEEDQMTSTTTSKTSKTHVRMFDGEKWDTYKVGGKKHRAAEARRAEFNAAQAHRKGMNSAIAKFLRGHDITPNGPAWTVLTGWAAKTGATPEHLSTLVVPEFVEDLRDLNERAGVRPPSSFGKKAGKGKKSKKASAEAPSTPTEVTEVKDEGTKPVRPGKKAQRKARSAAARKGWETRRANAAAQQVKAEPVETEQPKKAKGKKARFAAQLLEVGFTQDEVERAWALRG